MNIYYEITQDIKELYNLGELTENTDESGAGGFWDLAMELAEYQLSDDPTDKELRARDELATNIYYALLGSMGLK
jgi:hypothetical protein